MGGTDDFEVGICGEKKITLDDGTPSYLTLLDGTDPILDEFSINYDSLEASDMSDIDTVTVLYNVYFVEYEDINPNTIDDSFDFTITCPDTFTEDAWSPSEDIYDFNLLSDT